MKQAREPVDAQNSQLAQALQETLRLVGGEKEEAAKRGLLNAAVDRLIARV
ncbi:hypothetical protein BESB_026800 [Besnoitia besnoiti]|uniref:Uncharacterized protein n=1 Tax=Besnoitia besnoiti TaxID=94643 RepID=A0A2A9M739_BESBE|nr:uncharacterized protein BESB_026800 [Besnoitia besnoiti]PFH31706.1 hypothetical protein BESB_026800 [Besnoitia besnoiti]